MGKFQFKLSKQCWSKKKPFRTRIWEVVWTDEVHYCSALKVQFRILPPGSKTKVLRRVVTPKTFWCTNESSLPWLKDDLSWRADDFWDLRSWHVGTIDRRRGFDFLDWQLSEGFGSHQAPVVPIDCQVAGCRKLKQVSRILTEMHSVNHKIQDMMYSVHCTAQTTLGQPQWTAHRPKHPGTPQNTPYRQHPPQTPFQKPPKQPVYKYTVDAPELLAKKAKTFYFATSDTNESGLGEEMKKLIIETYSTPTSVPL